METKLDRIELNLENCQVAPISADYIISCNIGHCYSTYRFSRDNNEDINKMYGAESLDLQLDYTGLKSEQPWRETWGDDTSIADRLANYHDIVSVHLYFKPELKTETGIEKESPELYLPWNDENCEDENDCQTNYIDKYNGFDKQYKEHKILNIHVSEINHRNREI